MSLANVLHGHATPAAQGHFSPTTVPFSIPKLDGEMKTPSGTASDGEEMFFSPALPPPHTHTLQSPNSGSWKSMQKPRTLSLEQAHHVLSYYPQLRHYSMEYGSHQNIIVSPILDSLGNVN